MLTKSQFSNLLKTKILLLDGAMGTMIQDHKLEEKDFRGQRFVDHASELKGNNDLLSITKPDLIKQIHIDFLEAGSDIIETNTFNSNSISQSDYSLEEITYELNYQGAKLAKKAVQEVKASALVAGVLGPTNRTASLSPDVSDPSIRNVTFDELISKSDIISFHCKAAPDGKPLITKEHYKKMKPTSYIINAARGNIVDEKDLNDALNENLIAGAAIDVFSKEPAKENILFNNSKAILTPHIAASTTEASIVVAEMVANQISDFLLKGVKINTV